MLANYIKIKFLSFKRQRAWRRRNSHNSTICVGLEFPIEQVTVGRGTYGAVKALIFSESLRLDIGSFCSIAPNVSFIVGADHPTNFVSTFPYKVKVMGKKYEAISKGNIVVGDDVWIGDNAMILSGVTVGQGAVIAAGAVVTHDIPPYAIAAGVPAKVIKYRFSQDVISFLLTLDYSQLTEEMIKTHIDDLYVPLDSLSLDQIRSLYSWFPKKRADMAASATASAASSTATTPSADASADSAPSELTTTQRHNNIINVINTTVTHICQKTRQKTMPRKIARLNFL